MEAAQGFIAEMQPLSSGHAGQNSSPPPPPSAQQQQQPQAVVVSSQPTSTATMQVATPAAASQAQAPQVAQAQVDDERKVVEMMSAYPGDQCVVQTLQEGSPMPLAAAAATTPAAAPTIVTATASVGSAQHSPSSVGGQHQNIRDMDIIHVGAPAAVDGGGGVAAAEHTVRPLPAACGEHKLEPVNAASFGKLIRSVFLGLRTRRLGTRYTRLAVFGFSNSVGTKGQLQVHYYGIRVKPNSPLNQISEEVTTTALRQQSAAQAKR
ncbi:hypothetical protein HPB48_021128 [Haemaphysalis longicornis]|uniref:RFX-type winged-helix domain-containing protein n=1 Tax=Haemaphysalis longicornis TaxID=44386 RepID=A0A9J6FS52_HAELO|nr:hypothetical protein HPB48_021128 [Haemaphysalis longicornis]